MIVKNEIQNTVISNKNQNIEQEPDNITELIGNEKDFISLVKSIIDIEFEELFPKILNLPKLDFLSQLTSNVNFILTQQFSSKILENEKCLLIINSTFRNFDKIYNKYMEELSEGWDQYNFENINKNQSNKNLESYFLTKFRKHCCKTQDFAIHKCKQNMEKGIFIKIKVNSSSSKEKKIKYLVCNNCRMSFFIHEFNNYCEYCNTSYLCSPLIKDEDENFLPATLNQPHCETFINEKLLCQKCKNILYIDIKNNKLKCGNKKCNYSESIENNKKINFICKICQASFNSGIKIYNPNEVVHFKKVINKALLYKRKAYPGKLSCCQEIKEKKTDFFHKKDCRGKLYFTEYNHKIIIICSKCNAVNPYNKYIWICPECGLHFRDKNSQENEMKIRKTKSSNKYFKYRNQLSELENFYKLNVNKGNKQSLADLINRRKSLYEKNNIPLSNNFENYNTDINIKQKNDLLFQRKLSETSDFNEKTFSSRNINKKKIGNYIFSKIMPWGKGKKISSEKENNIKINDNENDDIKILKEKKYYEIKVKELNNPKNEYDSTINVSKSGRLHFRYFGKGNNSINNNEIDNYKKLNSKNLYRKFIENENIANKSNVINNSREIINNKSSIEFGYNINKIKSQTNNDKQISNDLKNKKFIPNKDSSKKEKEKEIIELNSEYSINNINKRNHKIISLFESQRIKKSKQLYMNSKRDISNKINNKENRFDKNKESWKSKETTSKGTIESKNSLFSHSPLNDNEEKTKKRNHKFYIKYDKNKSNENFRKKEQNEEEEDGIIPPDKINPEEKIDIEDKKIKENKILYEQIQMKLKRILDRGRLPRFNLNNFTIETQIGDGTYGVIYSVYNNKSKRKYAMKKIIVNNLNELEIIQKEFEIAHHNRHPSILDIKGVYIKCFDQTTYALYVLMDLAELDWEMEIDDRQMIKNFYNEKDLILILKQLSSALFFLQKEKNVAHRDIKPENVLIFKNETKNKNKFGEFLYKLCDFGEAKDYALIKTKKHKTLRGTELYMSPLLYDGLIKDEAYVDHNAYKSDVFSLGCCMIIAASLDFDIINEIRGIKEQIKISRFLKRKLLGKYSEKFIDVLLKMINFNEEERIDFIQLEEIIESTF